MKKKPVQTKLIYDEQKAAKRAYDLEYNKRAAVIQRKRDHSREWRQAYRVRKKAEGKCTRAGCEVSIERGWVCEKHKAEQAEARKAPARRLRQNLINAGKCPFCRGEIMPGKKSCRACADASNDRSKLHLYGITLGEYRQMLIDARGVCTICGSDKKIALDHDHATNRVRGILCHNCNVALGLVYDDDARLRALADYVVLHRALAMPKAV